MTFPLQSSTITVHANPNVAQGPSMFQVKMMIERNSRTNRLVVENPNAPVPTGFEIVVFPNDGGKAYMPNLNTSNLNLNKYIIADVQIDPAADEEDRLKYWSINMTGEVMLPMQDANRCLRSTRGSASGTPVFWNPLAQGGPRFEADISADTTFGLATDIAPYYEG